MLVTACNLYHLVIIFILSTNNEGDNEIEKNLENQPVVPQKKK